MPWSKARFTVLLSIGVCWMATYQVSSTGSVPDWSFAFQGPIYRGSDIYVVSSESSSKIAVWKSSDGGQTWTRQNAAGEVAHGSENRHSADYFGDTLRIYYASGASNFLAVVDFDMSADTWGSADVSSESGATTTYGGLCGGRRSDGSDVILFQAPETGGFSEVRYVIRASVGSWGSSAVVGGGSGESQHRRAVGIEIGASDRSYFIYSSGDNYYIYTKELPSGGSLSSQTTITTEGFDDVDTNGYPFGCPKVIGGSLYVPYVRTLTGFGLVPKLSVAVATDDGGLSFSHEDIDTSRPPGYGQFTISDITMADVGGVPWIVFHGYVHQDLSWTMPNPIWASRRVSGSWVSAQEMVAPLSSNDSYFAISANGNVAGTAVGIMFQYGIADLYFAEGSFAAASTAYRIAF